MTRTPTSPKSESPTDSIWFWVPIFLVGALLALMLALPKFRERQSQIERQFQARERSGHVVSAGDGYSPLSTTSKTMLTLKPLVFVLCIALFATTLFFWLRRFNFFGRTTVAAESDFAETREEEAH